MAQRGLVRYVFEEKHSPGWSYYFAKAFSEYGLTSLDRNAGLFALPSELVDNGLASQLCLYSHPGLTASGVYLEVAWPGEFIIPGSQYYDDYCANSGIVISILREFGYRVAIQATTGNILIDMSEFNRRYTSITSLYADALMRAEEGYSDRRYPLPKRIHYPVLSLPGQLVPVDQPGFVMRSNMTQRYH